MSATTIHSLRYVIFFFFHGTAPSEIYTLSLHTLFRSQFSDTGVRQGVVSVPKIVKTEKEWRKQLSSAAFDITRRADTEVAYTGAYWNLHDKGLFRCICCDTALFSSDTKFDSGTGWPSFWAPIAKENVVELADMSLVMLSTEVSCRCF